MRSASKMWRSSDKTTLLVQHVAEDGRKRCDDDDDEPATSNVDSGFLSGGNMQFSDEIGDSGLQQEQQGKGVRKHAPTSTDTVASSSSSSTVIAEESTRTVDSGIVDVDLSTGLSHLTLQQNNQNRLDLPGGLIQTEPTNPRLSSVSPTTNCAQLQDPRNAGQRQQNSDEKAINEEFWQFYTQDDDGDT